MRRARRVAGSAEQRLRGLQAAFFDLVRTPLASGDGRRARTTGGKSASATADAMITRGPHLSAFERVGIYNRGYWYRLRACMVDDFPGLRGLLGAARFSAIVDAYLDDCPSNSFTLRDLGERFPAWLARHQRLLDGAEGLALDIARLEWARVESFDAAQWPDLPRRAALDAHARLWLQPHVRLLRCEYPVDDLLSALEERRRPLPLRDRPAAEHVHLVVHRSDNELFFKRVGAAEFRVLQALQRGANLGDAALLGRDPDRVRALFELAASLRWFARPPKA